MKILWRSDRDKISFKAIKKHWYGLRKTVSKHLRLYQYGFWQGHLTEHTILEIIKAIQLNMHIEAFFCWYLMFSGDNNKNGLNSV